MGFGFKRITLDLIISRDPTTIKQPHIRKEKLIFRRKQLYNWNISNKIAALCATTEIHCDQHVSLFFPDLGKNVPFRQTSSSSFKYTPFNINFGLFCNL